MYSSTFFFRFKIVTVKKKPEISSGTATVVRSKSSKGIAKSASQNIEKELADDEVEEIISGVLSPNIPEDIVNTNWKTRYV